MSGVLCTTQQGPSLSCTLRHTTAHYRTLLHTACTAWVPWAMELHCYHSSPVSGPHARTCPHAHHLESACAHVRPITCLLPPHVRPITCLPPPHVRPGLRRHPQLGQQQCCNRQMHVTSPSPSPPALTTHLGTLHRSHATPCPPAPPPARPCSTSWETTCLALTTSTWPPRCTSWALAGCSRTS